MMVNDDPYVYQLISNEEDARLCAQLLAEAFVSHNAIAIYHRMSIEQYYTAFMWPMVQEALPEGLSFLARHRRSGDIVGTIIAGDMYWHQKKYPYQPDAPPQQVPLSDLMQEMCNDFIRHHFHEELKPQLVLHISVGATRDSHTRQGIAMELRRKLCQYARDVRGFRYAFVQVNNPATRHIYLEKLHGKELAVVDPTTWKWKKKDDGTSCPYHAYTGGPISNMLVSLD